MAYLTTPEGRIYFEHHAGGPITALLVHGWGASTRIWDVVAAAIVDAGFGVLSFDQRGCGASDKDFRTVSIEAASGDAVAIVDQLGLEAVVPIGWSIGGPIAVGAAERLGPRCRALVSTCGATPRFSQAPDFPHGAPPGSAQAMCANLRTDRVNFLAWLATNSVASDVGEPTLEKMRAIFAQHSFVAEGSLLDLENVDQRAILTALAIPILVVGGGKDALVDPGIFAAAAAMAFDGRLELFEEAGHSPFLEEPARYCELVIGFLRNLAAGAT